MRRGSRGASLVELMIGLALGLFIVAAASMAITTQLDDQRRLMMAAQVEQDLRAAVDLIARDLRRTGYWQDSARELPATGSAANAYGSVNAGSTERPGTSVTYTYSHDDPGEENGAVDLNDQTGAKLDGGVIKLLSGGTWQALTDADTVKVDHFQVAMDTQTVSLAGYCAAPCPPGAASCPPTQQVRSVTIAIDAHAAHDPSITRSLRTTVRLRNDRIVGACAG
jgi:type IV pilus assembly protein PilW